MISYPNNYIDILKKKNDWINYHRKRACLEGEKNMVSVEHGQ